MSEEWRTRPLRELTSKIGSGSTPRGGADAYKAAGVPLIRSMNVHFDGVRDEGLAFLDDDQARQLDGVAVRSNDVLLNITGASIGRVVCAPARLDGARVNQHVAILRPTEAVESAFLAAFFASPEQQRLIFAEESGATRQALTKAKLEEWEVALPSKDEQRRIVSKLDALRARSRRAKDALDAVPTLLDRLRQSILAAAFRGDLTADWREQNPDVEPASELLKRIRIERRKRWEEAELAKLVAKGKPPKDDRWKEKYVEPEPVEETEVPELPDGWCWASLREIADLKGGITKGQKRADETTLREVPYLRVANVQRGYLKLDEITTIAATRDEIADLELKRGDMLFNEGGDRDKLGRGWIWEGQIPECIHQNHVFRGRLLSDAIEPALVSHYTNSMGQEYFLREASQTTNLASINITKLGALPIPLLPSTEQRVLLDRLTTTLSAAMRLGGEAESARAMTGELERAVLAAAFRGAFANDDGVAQ